MCRISLSLLFVLFLVLSPINSIAEEKTYLITETELTLLENTLKALQETTNLLQMQLQESKTELMELSTKHEQSMNKLNQVSLSLSLYEKETQILVNNLNHKITIKNIFIGILAGVSICTGLGGIFIW